jgi:DNA-binding response OmpR family regulator
MKGKILIVDDDPLLVKMLEIKLTQENFVPYPLHDGQEALEKIQQIKPDVIIADIMMPRIDGYELHRRLRTDPATAFIPMVFLSAKTSLSDQLKGFRMGADDYVCKPFEFEDLLARVQKVIQRATRARFYDIRAIFSGNLRQMKIVDIIQLIELNHKTGELVFKKSKGKQIGKAFFKNGNLINSHMGLLNGEEAFYGLMEETEGYFEFFDIPIEVSQTITIPNISILLNGTRLIDEASGIAEFISDTDCRLRIKSREVSSALEAKIGEENINYLFQLVEKGVSFQKLLNSDRMSKSRAASALTHLLKEQLLEVEKIFNDPKVRMDKKLLLKIHEINLQGLSGVLQINNGLLKASIHFQQGEIIHAIHGMASGEKALFRILAQNAQELNFSNESLSEIKSIHNPLDSLLIDAIKEMQGLEMLDKNIFDIAISVNSERLNQISNKENPEELIWIVELVKKHEKIGDILEASQYTDLKTFKAILELNNLNIIDILIF